MPPSAPDPTPESACDTSADDEDKFFRFPYTPHLAWLGPGRPRDDKVLTPEEAQALLSGPVTVEEKLDGANLGLSLAEDGGFRLQNRGQYLLPPWGGQFSGLRAWLDARAEALFDALDPRLIVFGEWCAARHSLDYTALPDWWLVFDVYDRAAGRFWSAARRDRWAAACGLQTVPALATGRHSAASLAALLTHQPSRYRPGPMEGVVVRADEHDWLLARAKLVRADFTQSIGEHWRSRGLQWNRLGPCREVTSADAPAVLLAR